MNRKKVGRLAKPLLFDKYCTPDCIGYPKRSFTFVCNNSLHQIIFFFIQVMHGGLFSRDGVTIDELRLIDRNRQPPEEGKLSLYLKNLIHVSMSFF